MTIRILDIAEITKPIAAGLGRHLDVGDFSLRMAWRAPMSAFDAVDGSSTGT
jgi:hypothetical protein